MSLCSHFVSLCSHFVSLFCCFVSLSSHFASLLGCFVSLCSLFCIFRSFCGHFVSLCCPLCYFCIVCVSSYLSGVSLWLSMISQLPSDTGREDTSESPGGPSDTPLTPSLHTGLSQFLLQVSMRSIISPHIAPFRDHIHIVTKRICVTLKRAARLKERTWSSAVLKVTARWGEWGSGVKLW